MDEQADMLRSESAPVLHGGSNYFGASPTSRKRRHSHEILPALQPGPRSAALRPRRHSSCDEPAFGVGLAKRSRSINSRQDGDQGLTLILEDRECGTGLMSLIARGSEMAGQQTDNGSLPAQEQRELILLGTDNRLDISKQGDPGGSSTSRHILTARRRRHGLVHYDSPLEVAVSNPAIRGGDGSIPRSQVPVQNEVLRVQPQPPPAAARRRRFGVVTAPLQFAGSRTLGRYTCVLTSPILYVCVCVSQCVCVCVCVCVCGRALRPMGFYCILCGSI